MRMTVSFVFSRLSRRLSPADEPNREVYSARLL
jgi:hypothetical protein